MAYVQRMVLAALVLAACPHDFARAPNDAAADVGRPLDGRLDTGKDVFPVPEAGCPAGFTQCGAVCADLGTANFMVAALSGSLDPRFLPMLVFLLAAVTAFSTGTSWATMAILIPLAVPTICLGSPFESLPFDSLRSLRVLAPTPIDGRPDR